MKTSALILATLCVPALGQSSEWWLTESANYARPFRSSGFAGSQSDGYGVNGRLEYRTKPWIAVGLGYSETKLVQKGEHASLGYLDGSVRLTYANSLGLDPYLLVGLGGNTSASATQGKQDRGTEFGGQGQLGLLWSHPASSWAVDTGIGVRSTGAHSQALNIAEGHFGLQFRFGKSHTQAKEEYLRAEARRLLAKDASQLAEAVSKEPRNAAAWHGIGNTHYMHSLDQKQRAIKAWDRSLALKPNAKLQEYREMVEAAKPAPKTRYALAD